MFNFDEARFLRIQKGAVDLAPRIDHEIGAAIADGARNLYFLGTGGVAYLMEPAVQLLQRKSSFPVFKDFPAELVLTGSANLTDKSIVVMPSLSGTTRESVAMLNKVKEVGAKIITLIGHADTPLGLGGNPALVNFAEDDTSSESFYLQSLLVALSVMKAKGELPNYDALVAELATVPAALVQAKAAFEPRAEEFAQIIAGSDYHMFTGAGNMWPEALYYATCILEEMQWIRTRPVHASDFFHGPLELIDTGVSLVLFRGEDAYDPLAVRVEEFAKRYTDKLTVINTADYCPRDLSPELRALLSPAFMATLMERLSAYLEVMRDHPLVTRRYYKRVAY
ncbi:SIS domain-containing protein [Paracoccus sp. AK26]|uniref:SIS domain-containing protein n=1 Tax=Paracoccus sp. AK26 TaxID=2589076 RepID=UPI0014287043|nr:SIS domain-containing protein [Paracoccus sp. AK26]QIR86988.1 SIS domain-containing protein [Paracoccus sp. AK26]